MKSIAFLVLSLTLLAGCQSKVEETPAPAAPATTKTDLVDNVNGEGKLLCPVMNTVVDSKEAAHGYQDYNGKRYYFCCDKCPSSFKADPAKYASK
ncbi:MAG: YHS domain-containing protein [Armatimonadetes bacterium]|nr:YHS domain-containing protein [Armatimonadota bacterium]